MVRTYKRFDEDIVFQISGIPQTSYGFLKRLNFIFSVINGNIVDERKYNVLDVGCGTGEYLTIPIGSLTDKIEVLGIDTDVKSIKYAKTKNIYPNVDFECVAIEELDGKSKFDFIILSEVLEHLDEPKDMIMYINDLLKSDGICFITIPNGYGPFEIENKIFKFLKEKNIIRHFKRPIKIYQKVFKRNSNEIKSLEKDSFSEDPHVQFFTYKKFELLCSECGLLVKYRANRSFLAGVFSDLFINRSKTLINLNTRISDHLPYFAVSGWMFVVQKK